MRSGRRIAITTGVLFIVATVASLLSTGLTGSILDAPDYLLRVSANGNRVVMGALFQFVAAATSASIAIWLYPVLRKHNEGFALGAVGFRLIEGAFYIVAALGLLSLFTLSQEFVKAGTPAASYFQTLGALILAVRDWASFVFGATAAGLGAMMYYYVFYRSRLIPRWLSGWGLIGAALLLSMTLAILFSGDPDSASGMTLLLAVPIGLQEMVLALWLIFKGFDTSATAPEPAERVQTRTRESIGGRP